MANSTWKVIGVDHDGANYTQGPIEYSLRGTTVNSVSSFGTPVTVSAAQKMIVQDKWNSMIAEVQRLRAAGASDDAPEVQALLDTNISVTFSRSILLLLLSQAGCAGIKFYFCKNLEGHDSLVLVGVDEQNGDLQSPNGVIVPLNVAGLAPRDQPQQTLLAEVGGPKKLGDVFDAELNMTPYDRTLRQYFQTLLDL